MANEDAMSYCVICENEEDIAVLFDVLDSRGYAWIGGERLTEHFPNAFRSIITNYGYQELCFEVVSDRKFVTCVLSCFHRNVIIDCQTFLETCFGVKRHEEAYEERKELSEFLNSYYLEVSTP